ncbi:VOC family protein [Chengkuizengella axinellae]|uniref:VOC family protein n=1 Tax=Chengkuizengella axinellae TaxID=3064388 RepID=A0ABT9J4G9_9BACL|nr:VOC family protein [Chengkuizengella sp. 2205SS18-9]MDP5276453.1 VOC family protein [Chengkuizengella sp. 2205SS18-9]
MAAKSFHLQIVELPVKNVKESVEWYKKMFGLKLSFPFNEGDDEAWFNLNGMGFGLIQTNDLPKMDFISSKGERKPFFTFQVDNIKEFHQEMIQKGVEVQDMVFKQDGGYSFQFFDLNGNPLGIWGGWPKR